ncbi:hypothetical protein OPQ81_002695 [Rhizoctonia solani]|nr:hypothetical protein OPQ81_002695 [Rhizoctonia solani]
MAIAPTSTKLLTSSPACPSLTTDQWFSAATSTCTTPEWALVGSKWEKRCPKPYEQEFYKFTRNNDLHLFNEFTTPTCIHPNLPASNSIIDLTFLNSRAADAWPNFNLEVESQDSEHNVGLDHMAVTWTLTPFTPLDQDESDDPDTGDKTSHVIDPALHEDWVSGFSHALEQEDLPSDPIMAEDADRYAGAILSAMSSATRQVMPKQKKKGKGPGLVTLVDRRVL